MSKNLAAFTSSGCNYPSFISINEFEHYFVSITVRAPRKEDGSCGDIAAIVLSANEFVELLEEAKSNFQLRHTEGA